ncbi:MAG: hypothetical protein ABI690_13395 [Chloroflexota bacterium]
MRESKKLSEQQLEDIRISQEELYPEPDEEISRLRAIRDAGRLLDHIDAVKAEQVAALRGAIESVVSADALGQDYEALAARQANRIQDLEKAFRRVSEIVSYHYGEDENDDSDELNQCFEVLNANRPG